MIDPSRVAPPDSAEWAPAAFRPLPFGDFRAELLELYRPPLRAKKTHAKMAEALGIAAGLLGPAGTTAGLTPGLIARFVAGRPEGSSPHTTDSLLRSFRAACSYATARGYVRSDPFGFRKSWVRLSAPAAKKHHSLAAIRRVLDQADAEVESTEGWPRWRARRLRAAAYLFAFAALRKEEGFGLQVADLDLDGRMLHVVERAGGRLKTAASAAPVPLAEPLAVALAGWLPYRLDRPEGGHKAPPDCPWVFPNVTRTNRWKDGPMGQRPIDQIKALGERAGVAELTFLSFRHSFATHAERWGLSPAMIQRVLRHTSQKTQLHYRHADLDNLRAAVGSIGFGPAGAGRGAEG